MPGVTRSGKTYPQDPRFIPRGGPFLLGRPISCKNAAMAPRFLTLADVALQLNVSVTAVRVMVRSGELPAIQVGGRREWRIEVSALEDYIAAQYAATRSRIAAGELSS